MTKEEVDKAAAKASDLLRLAVSAGTPDHEALTTLRLLAKMVEKYDLTIAAKTAPKPATSEKSKPAKAPAPRAPTVTKTRAPYASTEAPKTGRIMDNGFEEIDMSAAFAEVAQFVGKCPKCFEPIKVGERILRKRGARIIHEACR